MGISLESLKLSALDETDIEILESPPGYVINIMGLPRGHSIAQIDITPGQARALLDDLVFYFREDARKMLGGDE